MEVLVTCFKCSEKLSFQDRVGLREECPKCRSDVHVCKNCEFYDLASYNECREPTAERVQDKERANRCEYFKSSNKSSSASKSKEDLLKAAEALFKKK